ncbi:MAG: hypothetical protein KKH32_11850 [Bacteroidetes bacterium]|nr:hypothetical protein [Bacteroidota bacterium]
MTNKFGFLDTFSDISQRKPACGRQARKPVSNCPVLARLPRQSRLPRLPA